jgi:hypothetical protein
MRHLKNRRKNFLIVAYPFGEKFIDHNNPFIVKFDGYKNEFESIKRFEKIMSGKAVIGGVYAELDMRMYNSKRSYIV